MLGLNAVNCHDGDMLAQEQVTANGKEQVLKALGDAATKLREKLGESLASVQKYDAPPENVTTPSLEALQAYSLAYQSIGRDRIDYRCRDPVLPKGRQLWTRILPWPICEFGRKLFVHWVNPPGQPRACVRPMSCGGGPANGKSSDISSFYELCSPEIWRQPARPSELWAQTYPRDDESRELTLARLQFPGRL